MNPTCPSAPIPPPPSVVQAKAVLPYNLAPSDPGYLSFAVDDIITIVEETDAVWWLGECNGCRGCFPAKYVEKITMASAHSGADVHPPPGVRTTDSSGLQQDPDQEGKKSKLGKFCITMAHSAAGGHQFGVGDAIRTAKALGQVAKLVHSVISDDDSESESDAGDSSS